MVIAIAPVGVSSLVVLAAIAAMTGGSFTAITGSVKDCATLFDVPSLTVKVISEEPKAFATGAMTAVQLGQVPPQVTAPVPATTLVVPDV